MPQVSVIMSVHQRVAPLREAVQAVMNQRDVGFELIVVDNGVGLSADELGVNGSEPRLRWLRQSHNLGIPAAHNAAVAAARGDFVALVDYDDRCRPDRLAVQLRAFESNPAIDLVSGRAECMDESGQSLHRPLFMLTDPVQQKRYSAVAAPVVTPASMVRKSALDDLPYRESFPVAADLDFQARFFETRRASVLPQPVLDYRCYAQQTTASRLAEIQSSMAIIQLLTARRRAGDDERIEEAVAMLDPVSSSSTRRAVARQAAAEARWELLALQARRLMAEHRSLGNWWQAMRWGHTAIMRAPRAERGGVAALFWRGPIRAWRLRPIV
jgi:hypothetical protein